MTVLVTGGRDYRNVGAVRREIGKFLSDTIVVQGGARGADALAAEAARECGFIVKTYEANWRVEGRVAGVLRNARMLRDARPDMVLAFPGGRGTADMVERARAANVPVRRVEG